MPKNTRSTKTESTLKQRTPQSTYTEASIQTLSSLEHIRLRSGMYIGRLGDGSNVDDGIYILLKEVIDNSVDEYIMGEGRQIDIVIKDNDAYVRDYGRGIPLGKIVECVSIINTGAKYNNEVFQFSVGLNGVGTKAVNALSKKFVVRSTRDGRFAQAEFERGEIIQEKKGKSTEKNGTTVFFSPDPEIFSEFAFNEEFIKERLWNYACLNSGLSLRLKFQQSANGQKKNQNSEPLRSDHKDQAQTNTAWQIFHSKRGLYDLLEMNLGDSPLYEILHYKGKRLEFAFTHASNYGETQWSFVNGQFTSDGGTHVSAFREGMLRAINDFFQKQYSGIDLREGMVSVIAVKLENPIFESQTKNKLGNTEIRTGIVQELRDALLKLLSSNSDAAEKIHNKIISNEKLRKELNIVRKEARDAARKIALKIPNLRDCKYHLGDKKFGDASTVFITEGASASGSMVSCRNVYTQAIFSLRGKPQNMYGRNQTAIYKNEEFYNMMMALGIENDTAGLRYAKIIIATDADHDGFHIRNLLLTFFLSFFEDILVHERIFILETPLFRVRNKSKTIYCYNKTERDSAIAELGTTRSIPEITRFKGLGEISPNEFGQFIGEDIRLQKVTITTIKKIQETLEFYMGKNSPDRRNFIMQNLIGDEKGA